ASHRLAARTTTATVAAQPVPTPILIRRRWGAGVSFTDSSSRMTQPLPAPSARAAHTPWRLKELRPAQVADILANDPRLIVPVGTCEQHGPHMPLGCDTIIVEHLADDFSSEFGILRAPTLEYGVNVD